jgi:GntR family transcriptional regulator/MocR family aminotransferase
VAEFLREGHYIRHLRRMKRLYASRRQALVDSLAQVGSESLRVKATAGLAVVVSITAGLSDVAIAARAHAFGLAPSALSPWCVQSPPWQGLLLGVTNLDTRRLTQQCRQLAEVAQ